MSSNDKWLLRHRNAFTSLPGCVLANCSCFFFSNIKATADSWLRNTERTIRCKWISCLSEVILEYFQMDGVIIIGTFVALINPFLFCQTMKPRYHKWAYSAPGHCYHHHVKPCGGWSGQRRIIYWKDCRFTLIRCATQGCQTLTAGTFLGCVLHYGRIRCVGKDKKHFWLILLQCRNCPHNVQQ